MLKNMEPYERYQVECSVLKLMIREHNEIIPQKNKTYFDNQKRQPKYPQYLPHLN